MQQSDFFAGNRRALRKLFTGTAPIVLSAHGLLQRSSDTTYPFRQNSNFWYLTGLSEPDIILVIDKENEYLIVPERDEHRIAFDGALDVEAFKRASGVTEVLDYETGWKRLGTRLKRAKTMATIAQPSNFVASHGLYLNPAATRLIELCKSYNPSLELVDLKPQLASLRVIKQEPELAAIQAAIDITTTTLKNLQKKLKGMQTEAAVEDFITSSFRQLGAAGHAYQPIVAGGKNACTLHYIANNAVLDPKGLLLLDVGAEVGHYAADITRTLSLSKPSKRQSAVHAAVLDVQSFAMGLLKPGILFKDYEAQVHQYLGEKLCELGLIKTISQTGVQKYYPHGTSHFLGLDVHDAGDYSKPLEADMVLTVEPGIYIPEEGIGVRIEDNVVITRGGCRNLSGDLPSRLDLLQ